MARSAAPPAAPSGVRSSACSPVAAMRRAEPATLHSLAAARRRCGAARTFLVDFVNMLADEFPALVAAPSASGSYRVHLLRPQRLYSAANRRIVVCKAARRGVVSLPLPEIMIVK